MLVENPASAFVGEIASREPRDSPHFAEDGRLDLRPADEAPRDRRLLLAQGIDRARKNPEPAGVHGQGRADPSKPLATEQVRSKQPSEGRRGSGEVRNRAAEGEEGGR